MTDLFEPAVITHVLSVDGRLARLMFCGLGCAEDWQQTHGASVDNSGTRLDQVLFPACAHCASCGRLAYEPPTMPCWIHEGKCPSRAFSRTTTATDFALVLSMLLADLVTPRHWQRAAELHLERPTMSGREMAVRVFVEARRSSQS